MPLPFILGAAAIIAGTAGVGKGIGGAVKMKEAKDTSESAQCRHEQNMERFNKTRDETERAMDEVGKLELDILNSFEAFSDTIEKIQGRPKFKKNSKDKAEIPDLNLKELKMSSITTGKLIFEAIISTSGLLGCIIASASIKNFSKQAEEAWSQMIEAEKQIDESCKYLNDLREAAGKYKSSLTMVYDKYKEIFAIVSDTVNVNNKIYWKDFTQAEKTATQNSVMLVALLYKMCQVKLVKTSEEKGKENTVNHEEINGAIVDSYKVMAKVG